MAVRNSNPEIAYIKPQYVPLQDLKFQGSKHYASAYFQGSSPQHVCLLIKQKKVGKTWGAGWNPDEKQGKLRTKNITTTA